MALFEEFVQTIKGDLNFFVMHGYTVSICQIGDKMLVVDGQYRLEAVRQLNDYQFNVTLRIYKCAKMDDFYRDFKFMNINTVIPSGCIDYENNFVQESILRIKNVLYSQYRKCFNKSNIIPKSGRRPRCNRVHGTPSCVIWKQKKYENFS